MLPDLLDGHWAYNGSQRLASGLHAGTDADAYVWLVTEDYGYGKVIASYTFFIDQVLHQAMCWHELGAVRHCWKQHRHAIAVGSRCSSTA